LHNKCQIQHQHIIDVLIFIDCGDCACVMERARKKALEQQQVAGPPGVLGNTTTVGQMSPWKCSGTLQAQHRHSHATNAGMILRAGNADDWRTNNTGLPAATRAAVAAYSSPSSGPTECRPFPDYDPKLNGRSFNRRALRSSCPECFLPDGSMCVVSVPLCWCFLQQCSYQSIFNCRVPPHYYNRSTWTDETHQNVLDYVWKMFSGSSSASLQNVRYLNISDDQQFAVLARKLLSSAVAAVKVDYATFNDNLQSLQVRPMPPWHIMFGLLNS
jgi:hypothetical protein